jgi:hypothetical protein
MKYYIVFFGFAKVLKYKQKTIVFGHFYLFTNEFYPDLLLRETDWPAKNVHSQ